MTLLHARTQRTGLCALSTVLLVSAAALGQPLSDPPKLGTAGKNKTAAGLPPVPKVLRLGPPVALLNDHLERIPKCQIVAGLHVGEQGKMEYTDTSGRVIGNFAMPGVTMVLTGEAAVTPPADGASSADTKRVVHP